MAKYPLLLFPKPASASRSNLSGRDRGGEKRGHREQWDEFAPRLRELQVALEAQRFEIQSSAGGIDPEHTLVLETRGSVAEFVNAVRKIKGMEWMGEVEIEEIDPERDFAPPEGAKREKSAKHHLYLITTNLKAQRQLLSSWERVGRGEKLDHGYGRFKEAFLLLEDIRPWGVKDRLEETGLLENWAEEVHKGEGERLIPCEVELWYRDKEQRRKEAADRITQLVELKGGVVLDAQAIKEIAYHGMLIQLPVTAVQEILDSGDHLTDLTDAKEVRFFRPAGQTITDENLLEEEGDGQQGGEDIENRSKRPPPSGEPVVAILDGLPFANHGLLKGRVIVDDPDEVEENYPAEYRIHGTGMASLVVHGDLGAGEEPLPKPVYTRPIMEPELQPAFSVRNERFPEDRLMTDLLHVAVKRICRGDGEQPPAAPSVRIINLSIGDSYLPFANTVSPMARLLDWLSFEYGVLFVVSAGNHKEKIALDPTHTEFEGLSPDEREKLIVRSVCRNFRHRRLLSPSETINGLTVGALHEDASQSIQHPTHRIDPYAEAMPSPVSAFGKGMNRAIKPDLIYPGGKQLLTVSPTSPLFLEGVSYAGPPGSKIAHPGTSGATNDTQHSRGTSNATALVSRAAATCYDLMDEILSNEENLDKDVREMEAPLLKAMLVHGCSWDDIGARLKNHLKGMDARNKAAYIKRWMGYGVPDIERVLDCTQQRATVLGFGKLSDGDAHIFHLPLPSTLRDQSISRCLTVTLAWLSPIAPRAKVYRKAALWFDMKGVKLAAKRQEACGGTGGWQDVRAGTVQHEIFKGEEAVSFDDNGFVDIQVNCRAATGQSAQDIPYGLVVSLEVAEGLDIDIYQEVAEKIALQSRAQVPISVEPDGH